MMKKYLPLILTIFLLSNALIINSQNYYFVFLNTNPDKEKLTEEQVQELQNGHLENIGRLHKDGVIVAAGPFDGGGGLFIMNEESIENVNKHLDTDPAISANRFNIEVFPLEIQNGRICKVPDEYEMGKYQFIRIRNSANNDDEINSAFINNRIYMADLKEDLLIHGWFNNKNDGFLILNTDNINTGKAIMDNHPSVQNGYFTYEIKPLWIARETFCKTN